MSTATSEPVSSRPRRGRPAHSATPSTSSSECACSGAAIRLEMPTRGSSARAVFDWASAGGPAGRRPYSWRVACASRQAFLAMEAVEARGRTPTPREDEEPPIAEPMTRVRQLAQPGAQQFGIRRPAGRYRISSGPRRQSMRPRRSDNTPPCCSPR